MPVISDAELQRRKEEILEGARHCFSEHGYEGATVRRLEEATGKSRGAIFHHFGDKENLFLAIAEEDARRQAEVVEQAGLVGVMRDILANPERYDWLGTRLEISSMLRTDPEFQEKWRDQQAVLDQALHDRLAANASEDRLRTDVPLEDIQVFLEIVLDGLISRLATGYPTEGLDRVLDMVEDAVRKS